MNIMVQFAVAAILAALTTLPLSAAPIPVPPASEILKPLKPEHPRLLATSADFTRLKERVVTDPQLQKWHAELRWPRFTA